MAGGSNSMQLRHYNERVVLDAVRKSGQASKAEIARFAHLTPQAVASIVEALAAAGYVRESGKRYGGKGQPSSLYELAPNGAYAIGLHIGRRALDTVLVDFVGHICALERHEYAYPSPDEIRTLGNRAFKRFQKHLGASDRERLVGVGISAPYFISAWDRELGFPVEIREGWRAINLASGFLETDGLPVLVENNSSAAAIAELIYGAGKQYGDFLHISLSTFVGAGLVMNGTLQTGPNGNSAAFGPFPVTPSSLSSVAKPKGTFEVLLHRASIYTLMNHLQAGGIDIHRVQQLDPMPPDAEHLVKEWQEDCADALAQAIIGTVAIVDLEAIFIDGLLNSTASVGHGFSCAPPAR